MIDPAFEIFEKLIIDFRIGRLDLETFSDDISEMSSEPEQKKYLAKSILRYTKRIYELNLPLLKGINEAEKDKIYEALGLLVDTYLEEGIFEPERVTSNKFLEERELITLDVIKDNQEPQIEKIIHENVMACVVCGELVSGYFQLDEHLGSIHPDKFTERHLCLQCGGMWLTIHAH